MKKKSYQLFGKTELLGSLPANKEVFSDFIATKAPDKENEELDYIQLDEKGTTIFFREPEKSNLVLLDRS